MARAEMRLRPSRRSTASRGRLSQPAAADDRDNTLDYVETARSWRISCEPRFIPQGSEAIPARSRLY